MGRPLFLYMFQVIVLWPDDYLGIGSKL